MPDPSPDDLEVRRRQENDDESAALEAQRRCKIQKQLDDALAQTFPASDPVSIVTSQHEEDWDEPPRKN